MSSWCSLCIQSFSDATPLFDISTCLLITISFCFLVAFLSFSDWETPHCYSLIRELLTNACLGVPWLLSNFVFGLNRLPNWECRYLLVLGQRFGSPGIEAKGLGVPVILYAVRQFLWLFRSVYVCMLWESIETVWHPSSLNCPWLGGLEVMGSFPQWDGRGTE